MLTSEVTPVTIQQIFTPHFGHQKANVMVMNDQDPSLLFGVKSVPSGNMPLPEPMLAKFYVTIWHQ